MEKEHKSSSESLTSEDCVRIFRDLVEWKSLRPPEPDDPVVAGMMILLSSNKYGGLIREGFLILRYDPIRQCWQVTITEEGLDAWIQRFVQ
jgi:hypothetical protein